MASRAQLAGGAAFVAAVGVLVVLGKQGKTPSVSLTQQAWGQSYTPWVFWMHQEPMRYFHHFPERIGANCLPQPYATQDEGQALRQVEVVIDSAACAQ